MSIADLVSPSLTPTSPPVPSSPSRPSAPLALARRWWLGLGGVLGCAAIVWLAQQVGWDHVVFGLGSLLPWLPLLLLLEAGRPALELYATQQVLTGLGAQVSLARRVRAQLLSHALDVVMPAGRTVAEAGKAAVLAPELGLDRAVAVGVIGQALTLIMSASGVVLCLGLAGTLATHAGIAAATWIYAVATVGAALLIAFVALLARPWSWLTRVPHVAEIAGALRMVMREHPGALLRATLALMGGRALQAGQLAVLLHALGAQLSLARVALASNLYVVSAAAGDFVPAQMGVTDGAFNLAAPSFGLTTHQVLALSLGLHVVQLKLAAVCASVFLLSRVWRGTRVGFDRSSV